MNKTNYQEGKFQHINKNLQTSLTGTVINMINNYHYINQLPNLLSELLRNGNKFWSNVPWVVLY